MLIGQDDLGWSDSQVRQFQIHLGETVESTLTELFWDSTARKILQSEDGELARIMRAMHLDKSSISRWRFPTTKVGDTLHPAREGSVPGALNYFKLFAVYSLNPADLPHGQSAAVRIWQRFFSALEDRLTACDWSVGRTPDEDEVFCLFILRALRRIDPVVLTISVEKMSEATIEELRVYTSPTRVKVPAEVMPTWTRWERHFTILCQLAPMEWYHDAD